MTVTQVRLAAGWFRTDVRPIVGVGANMLVEANRACIGFAARGKGAMVILGARLGSRGTFR